MTSFFTYFILYFITQNYGNGGLRMIDIASSSKALQSVWIRKYLDENNKGKCKFFFTTSSKNLEAKLFFGVTLTWLEEAC